MTGLQFLFVKDYVRCDCEVRTSGSCDVFPNNPAYILPFISLGIGDGGNELGMGKVKEMVKASMPNGGLIACDVPADYAITAGMDIASLCCLSNVNTDGHTVTIVMGAHIHVIAAASLLNVLLLQVSIPISETQK